jgi:hypothetical protein
VPTDDSPSPPTVPLEITPQQIGRYRVLERLGAGGMGAVYRAHDPQLDRVVAIKVPLFDVPRSQLAQRIQRFQREARAAAQVWHPHVCPIYDVGEHEGQPYVVMAYVEGRSLATRLAAGRFENPAEAVTLTLQLLEALDAVHAKGIIHRDLKPGNIMLDAAGHAILMDFGLARPEQQTTEHLTSDGVVLGTPSYMAPEQAAGQAERVGPWTDLYSLGVVLYQMLTGRLTFEGPPLTVLARIVHESPPPPRSLRPDLDPALEAILLRALAKECEARYPSARDFAGALKGWLHETGAALTRSVVPVPSPTQERDATVAVSALDRTVLPARPGRHRPRGFDWLTAVMLVAGGLTLLFIILVILGGGPGPPVWLGGMGCGVMVVAFASGMVVLQQLLRRKPDPRRVLLEVAESGQVDRLKRLIRQGVDLEARDEMGETALMKAAHKGYINTVKLLLANGADVNAKNPFGETALSLATREGRTYIAELLRQAGARE